MGLIKYKNVKTFNNKNIVHRAMELCALFL